jgi:hypothetical protein
MIDEGMVVDHSWSDTDRRTPNVIGENPVLVPLRPPQIPNVLACA